jgi:hypothetical protein
VWYEKEEKTILSADERGLCFTALKSFGGERHISAWNSLLRDDDLFPHLNKNPVIACGGGGGGGLAIKK